MQVTIETEDELVTLLYTIGNTTDNTIKKYITRGLFSYPTMPKPLGYPNLDSFWERLIAIWEDGNKKEGKE